MSCFFLVLICFGLSSLYYLVQRPLEDIANREGSVFVPRGVDVPCLDQDKDWEFKPCNFREGQVCGSDVICSFCLFAGVFTRVLLVVSVVFFFLCVLEMGHGNEENFWERALLGFHMGGGRGCFMVCHLVGKLCPF